MTSLSSFRIGLDVIIIINGRKCHCCPYAPETRSDRAHLVFITYTHVWGLRANPPVIHVVRVSWKMHSPLSLGSGRKILCILTTEPAQKVTFFTYTRMCTYAYLHTHFYKSMHRKTRLSYFSFTLFSPSLFVCDWAVTPICDFM